MLLELTITDFAIVDRLALTLSPGFNVLTGETGAGKSIVIDAVGALLGSRLGADYVRAGASLARVEGIFHVGEDGRNEVQGERVRQLLAEYGVEDDEGTLILCREIGTSGRTISRVNGRAVPVAVLQQVGGLLVDIHGQSEHLSLLRVSQHLDLLDEYAGLRELRARTTETVSRLRQVRRDLQSLMRDERELARRNDLLRFQVAEIDSAALKPGEEDALNAERRILSNSEVLIAAADRVYQLLYEGLDEQRSVSDLMSDASLKLGEMARLDPGLQNESATVEGILLQVEESARALRAYRDRIEYDPARLEEIEERLELIRTLRRKYGNSIEEILRFGTQATSELESLSHRDERTTEMQDEEATLLGEIAGLAMGLSQARARASVELASAMEEELADLNMPKARFGVALERTEAADGVPFQDGRRYAFDANGVDKVEFTVSPNPGEPLKPLAKIASGGETARLMLALKTILSRVDPVPTLIFDEVDQGIGGRSGQIVGKKLWNLSRSHQVICITHLPQIACFADAHFSVSKRVDGDKTFLSVRTLGGNTSVEEIMAMLGGVAGSEVARRNADEMLNEASAWKEQVLHAEEPTASR